MNLTYTTADVTDITPIYQFCKKLIDTYENLQTIPYDKVLNWVRTKIETNIHEYQCIWLNGQKVGYYHFFQNGEKMELDNFYIFPEFQKQGIGTQVLQKCIEESQRPIFLYVFQRNTGAVALYQRLGFRIVENIENSRYIMLRE
ncbi:MAG: GNAT family N-acetyltransferase [Ruminococcus sp.]|nr:GNAT family N-acetyltransferase [Ruminococcus sp.]